MINPSLPWVTFWLNSPETSTFGSSLDPLPLPGKYLHQVLFLAKKKHTVAISLLPPFISLISMVLAAASAAKSHQLCQPLCNPTDGSRPGSSIPAILQARVLEWVAIAFSTMVRRKTLYFIIISVQFSSVTHLCPTLCNPMNHSTPGLPVHHQLPEFTQTHVHWVSDAIQSSHRVVPFFSRLQSFPASGSFQMSQFFL